MEQKEQQVTSVVVADVEKHLKDTLVDALKKGKKFRLVTDNVNFMHMKAFKPFKGCLEAITGDYNDSLKHKHEVIPLPVLRKNEMKNTDVIDILDYYEEFISSFRVSPKILYPTDFKIGVF
nr:hypothetical protein BaRGS_034476 [Batillaria attramentaria]